tara:strand:- start:19245 stop:20096 length:852 start_codon:yes stop_codon:yes gene_type:complete
MMRLHPCYKKLELTDFGYWIPEQASEGEVHYPDEGHQTDIDFESKSFWYKHRNDCIVAAAKNHPPRDDAPAFDLGGGSGYVTKAINDAGIPMTLIEPNPLGASKGVRRGLQNVICSRLEDCQISNDSVGGFGLYDVVEHIEDDKAYIDMLHKKLIEGGTIHLTVPAYQWLWSAEDQTALHFRRYSLEQAKQLFDTTQFSIDYASYFFQWLVPPIYFIRSLPHKLGLQSKENGYKSNMDHHESGEMMVNNIIGHFNSREVKTIQKNKTLSFGASCMVIARKTDP